MKKVELVIRSMKVEILNTSDHKILDDLGDKYLVYSFIDKDKKPYYVGQTANLTKRLNMHIYLIKGKVSKGYLKACMYPYYCKARKFFLKGEPLRVLILKKYITREEADNHETYFINKYKKDPNIKLYNLLPGGRSGQKGKYVSEETKRKISEAKKGKSFTEEHKLALKLAVRKKHIYTEEELSRMRLKVSIANTGKKHSDEWKKATSLKKLGIKFSDEVNKKKGRSGKDNYRSKCYNLISPTGEKLKIYGLSKFCKEHGLIQSGFWLALHRNNNTYKGWTIWEES